MKSLILAVVAGAAALSFGTGAASASSNAERAPVVWRSGDVQLAPSVFDPADGSVLLEKAQWIWGGRNYCWYINGWRGPATTGAAMRGVEAMAGAARSGGTAGGAVAAIMVAAIMAAAITVEAATAAASMVAAVTGVAVMAAVNTAAITEVGRC